MPARPAAAAARPRDADVIANRIVEARTWSLYHIERARHSRSSRLIRSVTGVARFLDRAGLELSDHVNRAYAAARSVSSSESAVVFEHTLAPAEIDEAFAALLASPKTDAKPIDLPGTRALDVSLGWVRRVVAAPTPELLVVLPEWARSDAARFSGSGGLPLPTESESALFYAEEPWNTVPGIEWPDTFENAQIRLHVDGRRGAKVEFLARDSSAEQATVDADLATARLEELLTLDVTIATLRLLGPYTFRARGPYVTGDAYLAPEELDWLAAMTLKLTGG